MARDKDPFERACVSLLLKSLANEVDDGTVDSIAFNWESGNSEYFQCVRYVGNKEEHLHFNVSQVLVDNEQEEAKP